MARITTLEEFEQRYTEGLHQPLPLKAWREVTTEWLARHSEGSGDYNPLHRDAEYARDARHHSLVASPSFLFSIDFGANASIWGHLPQQEVSMNDLSILYLGADVTWHRPVWLGDRVRSIQTPVGVRRTASRQLGEALVCTGRTDYYNHRAELVASMTNHMLRFANPGQGVESARTTDAPQVAPDPLVWQRTRRGAQPLCWEDVAVGDELPALPKGTYTTTELYLFSLGTLTMSRSRAVDEGTIDMGAGGRADPEYARRSRAQSTSFDYGPQRITWLAQIVADWMGDAGDLLSMSAQLRRPNLIGDTNTVVGRVLRTYDHEGEGRVDVRVAVVNQDEQETATARATVRLPRAGATDPHAVLFSPTVPDLGASPYG
ncbi:MaoC family dehydratase N-terminal domain-containing protein [Rhodococcus sp. X156]|uniref:MaoC family dehydratase n=1 Tax=Rhodococcus sp. X156 TaxID=2499145 RepID=UPI000FD7096E|nr:MaoC family dehydratase N-terminal domain-containing protein [Rhodococcus sp. X156]